MPTIPNSTKCSHLGCKETRSRLNSYCSIHGGLNDIDTKDRKEFKSMYQSARWKQTRYLQLSKQPLCQCCLITGKIAHAEHIDHLFAWSKIGKEAFYNNILQSLCANCHSNKTALEKKGIYRYYAQVMHDYTINDYATVVLMQHSDIAHT